MSTPSSPLSQAERQAHLALERYTLILPLLRAGSATERHQLRQQLVAHPPPPFKRLSLTTLYRWEKAWAQGGFEGTKETFAATFS